MLALLHVVVQSYSLGSTLPARTRATRCSSARCLSEGQDYMLQELNPAKAGILCGPPSPPGHAPPWPPLPPLSPRPSPYRLRSCRCPNHSTSHAARPPLTTHHSRLTKLAARMHRILTWARAAQGLRADGFKPNTEAIGDRMVQLKAIDKAL